MEGTVLFTAFEGTGKESLCNRNFIKPLKGRVISVMNIRDIIKGDVARKSLFIPVLMRGSVYPSFIELLFLLFQALPPLVLLLPYFRKRLIIARGIPAGFILSLLPGVRFRLFVPGIYSLEAEVYSKRKDSRLYRWMEERALRCAERVFVPLKEIGDFYKERCGIERVEVVFLPVYRCDKKVEKFKDYTIVYLGTIPDRNTYNSIVETYLNFKEMIPGAKLLVISRWMEEWMRKGFQGIGAKIVKVPQEEVLCVLARCHVGLVMEGENPLSPYLLTSKFCDYMGAEIPVIVHRGMKGLCRLVEKYNLGISHTPGSVIRFISFPRSISEKVHSDLSSKFTLEHFTKDD